jgi:hypothetical protein
MVKAWLRGTSDSPLSNNLRLDTCSSGQSEKIGQGDLADLAALANGLTQQNRGRGASIRDYVDIHGLTYANKIGAISSYLFILHGYIVTSSTTAHLA